ncbi:MAG TPA: alpha/beta fold hydrolase [Steroidobacteraceae bacterium]|nr:alpha/beta fold hydrolase [Steroidobacteraceae bacterium]
MPLAAILLGAALRVTGAAAPAALTVGSLTLTACRGVAAYCGSLDRPLDPSAAVAGRIAIHFEYYPPRRSGKPLGTLVATEGGPGYPATLSRDDYLALFRPLRARRAVVLMDNRGTGRSAALDCAALQSAPRWTVAGVAACGRSLGDTAALYSTAYAADDLAAILEALGIRRIDLYGDSYGTYFEQVFAVRHPGVLRSIVLDGAYPLNGPDYAWVPNYAPAMRDKFDILCRRFPPCARLPGSSIDHVRQALARLRAAPFAAAAFDANGRKRRFIADAAELATVTFASAPAIASARETDAAARAFVAGDAAPLLRLMAETDSSVDSRDPADDPKKWSAGLAAAVMCQDPPQIFDMRLAPALRARDRDAAIARREREFPDSYAPFTIDEYRAMPLDYSYLDECVGWPVAPAGHAASHVVPRDAIYPRVPALIVSGELDDITPVADGAAVARAFPHGRQVVIANSFHVNALPRARSGCAARIVRHFIVSLAPGDTRCAARVPPLVLVARFAERSADLAPASALPGNRADAPRLRAAAAAVMTLGDVLVRAAENSTGRGPGLRGGSFHVLRRAPTIRVDLEKIRWTEDLAVSGVIDAPAARAGAVRARIRLYGPDQLRGVLRMRWRQGAAGARAAISGTLGGEALRAAAPAP